MNGIRTLVAGAAGPLPDRNSVNTNRRDASRLRIASARRADEEVARVPTLTLTAQHEQWSQAVTQILRLTQARSSARLHLATAAADPVPGISTVQLQK